jgi:hypothetical protein
MVWVLEDDAREREIGQANKQLPNRRGQPQRTRNEEGKAEAARLSGYRVVAPGN